MSAIKLLDEDVDRLGELIPDLVFTDPERRSALLENGSRDIHAVPGSGKTSLLAAKLMLIATKWPYARKGVCVLSHTNVAKDEIRRRLSRTPDGMRLLDYPHYIGTIHGFINQFIALPYIRSQGLQVDAIDDDLFARRACGMAYREEALRALLRRREQLRVTIEKLYYRGAQLELGSEGGKIFKSGPAREAIFRIKATLSSDGIFRHRDMFAYAEAALASTAPLVNVVSRRFPMLFLDEMQDTSWEHEQILTRLFEGKAVVQRYGDVDQTLQLDSTGSENLTFPRENYLPISSSKRFGPHIAQAVERVRVSRNPVVGDASDVRQSALILYSAAKVGDVIPRFGRMVLERFSDAMLQRGSVKAVCSRRNGGGDKQIAGRSLDDYWPPFSDGVSEWARPSNFWALMGGPATTSGEVTLHERANDVRRALLLVLRAIGAPVAADNVDTRRLTWQIQELKLDANSFRRLVLELSLRTPADWSAGAIETLPQLLFDRLGTLLPPNTNLRTFAGLDCFKEKMYFTEQPLLQNVCSIEEAGRKILVEVGTTFSKKGETHIATLVLESVYNKKYDLANALEFIAGLKNQQNVVEPQRGQLRSLYVAMSRPTSFLCLAMNVDRAPDECVTALEREGWVIDYLT